MQHTFLSFFIGSLVQRGVNFAACRIMLHQQRVGQSVNRPGVLDFVVKCRYEVAQPLPRYLPDFDNGSPKIDLVRE